MKNQVKSVPTIDNNEKVPHTDYHKENEAYWGGYT